MLSTISNPSAIGCRLHGGIHLVDITEGAIDGTLQIASRRLRSAGCHQVPEERMIPVAAEVVAHRRSHGVGHGRKAGEDFLGRLAGQIAMLLHQAVEVADERIVMVAVMEGHGGDIDVRLQGLVRVVKRRQRAGSCTGART
jgi:hypothetical protein